MPCIDCGRGWHDTCWDEEGCEACHPSTQSVPFIEDKKEETELKEYKDRSSTGRHRAAVMYPIICRTCNSPTTKTNKDEAACNCDNRVTDPCEWQGKKNCGGGVNPIVGCKNGSQEHRHHGPIKDPLRNEVGNVHRICSTCHNRWHMINDLYYIPAVAETQKHDPIQASEDDINIYEMMWQSGEMKRKFNLKNSKANSD